MSTLGQGGTLGDSAEQNARDAQAVGLPQSIARTQRQRSPGVLGGGGIAGAPQIAQSRATRDGDGVKSIGPVRGRQIAR